jgi:hypothetical protein
MARLGNTKPPWKGPVIEAEQKLQTSTVLKLETDPEIQDRPRGSRGITRFALSHLRSSRTGSHLGNRIWMPSIPRVRLPNRSRRQGLIAITTYRQAALSSLTQQVQALASSARAGFRWRITEQKLGSKNRAICIKTGPRCGRGALCGRASPGGGSSRECLSSWTVPRARRQATLHGL